MYKIAEDELICCPYNRYHLVSKLRIQRHLIKCKEHYPNIKLTTCFYNYSHKFKPEDTLKHYENCPNKARVEGRRYCDSVQYFSETLTNSDCDEFSLPKGLNKSYRSFGSVSTFKSFDFAYEPSLKSVSEVTENNQTDKVVEDMKSLRVTDDGDLEPLPLPKTCSKAFICVGKVSHDFSNLSIDEARPNGFGRAYLLNTIRKSQG